MSVPSGFKVGDYISYKDCTHARNGMVVDSEEGERVHGVSPASFRLWAYWHEDGQEDWDGPYWTSVEGAYRIRCSRKVKLSYMKWLIRRAANGEV